MNDWSKAIVSVAVCAAVAAGTYFTSNANCLWALLIVPILYKAL
jgi:hypothetical protein